MQETDLALIKKRSIRGIFALTSRTFFIQIVTFISSFILTIFLSPEVFGVFFVVSAAISFLSYFSDIGLAAALIQKKDQITDEDLKTTFTIQQALVLIVVTVAFLSSDFLGKFYNLSNEGVILFKALSLSFFLSSLKTIPSVILERDLRFEKLVIPQIVETILFNLTAVVLAIGGFGIVSFTYAVLIRGFSGLLTIYLISPWRIRIGFSKDSAKKLLSFGIPFQLNNILALIKDDLFVAYLGKVLPFSQVGFIGFAQKWAFTPLRLIMDNVIRITFPSFSRLQEEKDVLKKAIEKSIFAASFFIFPSLVGLVVLSPYFIDLIPRYSKWEPALLSLAFFVVNAVFSSVSTPLTNALNAIGKIKITLYLMIFWTIATWTLGPFLINTIGFNGVAISSAIISLSSIAVIFITKKYVEFNAFSATFFPFLSASIMGVFVYFVSPIFVKNLSTLFLMILMGAVIYFLCIFVLAKRQIIADFNLIKENLGK